MATDFVLSLAGQTLHLLPERCVFWKEAGVLLLADLHLGKAAHLRHYGMAVPEGHTADDLTRLTGVIRRTGAREVVICGDFFHAPTSQSEVVLELVCTWREAHPEIAVSLVTGNHDRGRALPPGRCGILSAGTVMFREPFHFIHDPTEAVPAPGFTISGHLHPYAALSGAAGPSLRAPCFWWQAERSCLVLPGFGSFTGGVAIQPGEGDLVHAICHETVTALPVRLLKTARPARFR